MHGASIGGDAPFAPWVAERQHGGHRPALLDGYSQYVVHAVREIAQHHRHDPADALGASGEQRAPNRRIDIGPAQVVDREHEEQQGNFFEVVSQVIARPFDPPHHLCVSAVIHTGCRCHHRSRPRLELLVFHGAALTEQLGELAHEFPIVDGHEVPALGIGPIGRADGSIQNADLRVQRNRIGPQPPHHPGGVQRFIDVHFPIPFPYSSRYSGQVLLRMMSTKFSRVKVGSKCASTSSFTVPKVLCGRCFMPSLNAARMLRLKSGRGGAAGTAARGSAERSSRPMPSTSVSTPAVTKAISAPRNSGIPGVVCKAMPSHTLSASLLSTPRSSRKSRAAFALSTSKRRVELP